MKFPAHYPFTAVSHDPRNILNHEKAQLFETEAHGQKNSRHRYREALHQRATEVKTDTEREGYGDKALAASLPDLPITSLPIPLLTLAFLRVLSLAGPCPVSVVNVYELFDVGNKTSDQTRNGALSSLQDSEQGANRRQSQRMLPQCGQNPLLSRFICSAKT